MTTKDVVASHLRPEQPRDTYEQIARELLPLRYWERRARKAWAVDVLLAADLSVRDYDVGVELLDVLIHGTAKVRRDLSARLLGSTT